MKKIRNRKNWKRFLALLLCLLFVQAPALHLAPQLQVSAAEKTGLTKKKGNYYFYNSKGVKIKNKWKKINGSYYYFGANGAAVKGKTEMEILVPAIKTIGGKKYAFDAEGKRMSGVLIKDNKLFVFDSDSGAYNAGATQKVRKASGNEKPASALKTLLDTYEGKPLEVESIGESCYGDGEDMLWHYKNFTVSIFHPKKGTELVMGVMAN